MAGSPCWFLSARFSASGSSPAGWLRPGPQASGSDECPSHAGPGNVASISTRCPSSRMFALSMQDLRAEASKRDIPRRARACRVASTARMPTAVVDAAYLPYARSAGRDQNDTSRRPAGRIVAQRSGHELIAAPPPDRGLGTPRVRERQDSNTRLTPHRIEIRL